MPIKDREISLLDALARDATMTVVVADIGSCDKMTAEEARNHAEAMRKKVVESLEKVN